MFPDTTCACKVKHNHSPAKRCYRVRKEELTFTGNGCCSCCTCNLKFSMSLTESEGRGGEGGGTLCEEDLDFPLNSNAGISFSRSLPDSQIDQGWDLKLYWVIFNQATVLWKGQKQWNQHIFRFSFSIKISCHHNANIAVHCYFLKFYGTPTSSANLLIFLCANW